MTTPRNDQGRTVLAIDPGTRESAIVEYDPTSRRIARAARMTNTAILTQLRTTTFAMPPYSLVIESLVSYGLTVGEEVFTTAVWIGRFFEAWQATAWSVPTLLSRKDIKLHVCGALRATDKDIREALIVRWGGEEKAIGGVRCKVCKGKGAVGRQRAACSACAGSGYATPPGPLHRLAGDEWSALAVAVTYAETKAKAEQPGATA